MRIVSFTLKQSSGLDLVQANDLSDVVVFAGPNGVGKTRLLNAFIQFFREPRGGRMQLTVEATSDAEVKAWKKARLDTAIEADAALLQQTLQKNQRRNKHRSTVLNFESDRAIAQVRPFSFSFDVSDPFEEDVSWEQSFSFLRDRFQDVQHSLFRLVESQRQRISSRAVKLKADGARVMELNFSDPLADFKKAFHQLLGPKVMLDLDPRDQQIYYEHEGVRRPISTLSSGEKEVLNIVFDFILRNPSDCIVFFDEPELHLHPELSYKLLQTLSSSGANNQFIFCTHSPDIITASIEHSVVFLTPKKTDGSNQALQVSRDDATHHALNLLGQSIGIISLGKRLLLIEGQDASLDKQTYGAILKNAHPDLVLVPVGGRATIHSFEEVRRSVLNKTIWGVEFFMLCDRDALHARGPASAEKNISDRLRVLPRYHLENYFLEPAILARVFEEMEGQESWLRDPSQIDIELKKIASQVIPIAVALRTTAVVREAAGNIDAMPNGLIGADVDQLAGSIRDRIAAEQARIGTRLQLDAIETDIRQEYRRLLASLSDGTDAWKVDVPGRIILHRFAAKAQIKSGRLKPLYIKRALESDSDPFAEIRALFAGFEALTKDVRATGAR